MTLGENKGELEFAKRVLKLLDASTLQVVIKRAAMNGFTVQGFNKNIWLAPKTIIGASLGKKKNGKFQSSIFLEAVSGLDENNQIITLVKEWVQNEDERERVEGAIKKIELDVPALPEVKEEVKEETIIQFSDVEKKKEDNEKSKQKQLRINKLENTIQNLRSIMEKDKKEIAHLRKENLKVKKQLEENQEKYNELKNKLESTKVECKKLMDECNKNEQIILQYVEVFKRAPKVLCFSKKQINKDNFPFYDVSQLSVWKDEYEQNIDWSKYREIWIIEADFNYPEVIRMKNLPCKKIILSRNVKSLIEKVGGIQ